MQQKKIGIVCTSPGFGGLEMATLHIAQSLQEKGWEVHLLVNQPTKLFKEAKKKLSTKTIQEYGVEKLSPNILRKWNKQIQADILYSPYNKDLKALSFYKRFFHRQSKLIYHQHMKVGVKKKDFIHRLRYQMIDRWITPLDYLKEEVLAKTTVPAHKIAVVSLGLDFKKLSKKRFTKSEVRNKLILPEGAYIIGVLGRIDPKKGQDFLIKVLASLDDDIHLLIMGNITEHEGDNWLQYLHELVDEFNVKNRVHFRPYQEEVAVFYEAIDVFAMPSHGETYGLVTLEAMYFKKPVIGVDTDGTKAILEKGKYGWLHQQEDIAGFTAQLDTIKNEPEKTQLVITKAYEQVKKSYDYLDTVAGLEVVLSKFI